MILDYFNHLFLPRILEALGLNPNEAKFKAALDMIANRKISNLDGVLTILYMKLRDLITRVFSNMVVVAITNHALLFEMNKGVKVLFSKYGNLELIPNLRHVID